MRGLYVNNFRPFLKKHNVQVILHAGPIFVGEDYQCRRQLVTFGETPKAEFRCFCALMSLSLPPRKSGGERHWKWEGPSVVLLNQNVPRIPIPKNMGGCRRGQQKRSFDVPTKRETFAFLEVQVDKNLAVGEKVWQIGG